VLSRTDETFLVEHSLRVQQSVKVAVHRESGELPFDDLGEIN